MKKNIYTIIFDKYWYKINIKICKQLQTMKWKNTIMINLIVNQIFKKNYGTYIPFNENLSILVNQTKTVKKIKQVLMRVAITNIDDSLWL